MDAVAATATAVILGGMAVFWGRSLLAQFLWSPCGRRIRTRYEIKKLRAEVEEVACRIRQLEEQQSNDRARLVSLSGLDGFRNVVEDQMNERAAHIKTLRREESEIAARLSMLLWATQK